MSKVKEAAYDAEAFVEGLLEQMRRTRSNAVLCELEQRAIGATTALEALSLMGKKRALAMRCRAALIVYHKHTLDE